ncbi:MAG: cell division protein FtsL [Gammaproteobacteria bacterium]|nr:cell division protein FtsL [Gammaproteobacteria bacterium]MBI91523.1 cell division protein FtsL [Gammaproteobacteria bacterium]MCH2577014.1 cell division protein FtsL [Pseudomonadales bacterium]MED5530643.1 cell division protein FtsL [Pseudomonadota bacterium]HBY00044.1 cell division protein FtsL [Gammaproteobacteria bacterium]
MVLIQANAKTTRRNRRVAGEQVAMAPSVLQWSGLIRPASLGLVMLLVAVLGSGLSIVYTTHQSRFAFNELQELKDQSNQLETEWGQLLIEQSTFGVEGRIDQKAAEQLQMQVPELSKIVMVEYDRE